jgi:hypothetical protein
VGTNSPRPGTASQSIADDPDVRALIDAAQGMADTSRALLSGLRVAMSELRRRAVRLRSIAKDTPDAAYYHGMVEGLAMAEKLISAGNRSQRENDK